jgi:AraC-like DNA-binding protein
MAGTADAEVTTRRHASSSGSWEIAERPAAWWLRGVVAHYSGYREKGAPIRRREMPSGRAVLILGFGAPLRVLVLPGTADCRPREVTSFVSGLGDGPTVTEHNGDQSGVEIALTPLGAYSLFGVPMWELTNAVVELTDLWGRRADELSERLAGCPGWAARFDLLDSVLTGIADSAAVVRPEVRWAWERLERTAGTVSIAELVEEIGWSRRHLAANFRQQVGLTPKAAARVLRFDRARSMLTPAARPALSDIAVACGYYDQAHFSRDFRDLAGCTPTAYLAAQLPGVLGTTG